MKPIFVCIFMLSAGTLAAQPGTELGIDPARITVSGISSGGAMAHQLHVAFPELFSGAAIIAGPPYGCADGNVATAFARCMGQSPGEYPVDATAEAIEAAAAEGKIGDPELLADDRVWLFHATGDTVVAEPVSAALAALYGRFVEPGNLLYVNDFDAAHTFPTEDRGKDCSVAESPFIGACGYDAAGELLGHLYPGLKAPSQPDESGLASVHLAGADRALLDETAWLYVPKACREAASRCALHLVLHGCGQSASQIGTTFIEQAGYLKWAESNAIVLAFPQARSSAGNPLACWDWWGYTGPEYATRDGAQMKLLSEWIKDLAP